MGHFYLDSSALVKRYVTENGTIWINNLCAVTAGHTLYLARISGAEIVAALFRRTRSGLTIAEAQAAVTQFKADFQHRYQVVEITEPLIESAMVLAEKYILRGYDAVQLAAALELYEVRASLSLSPITFICADDQLNTAAAMAGLVVENPNTY